MRILFHHRIRSKDGQFVHLDGLTRALVRQGHEVRIVGPRAVTEAKLGASAGVVDALKRALPPALYELLEFAYAVPAYFRLAAAIRRFRPDVIYERYQLYFPTGVWAQRRHGLPLILEVNAPLVEERAKHARIALHRLAAWTERFVWNGADHVLPVTEVLADKVRAAGVPDARVSVIPNGIDFEDFRDLPTAKEAKACAGLAGRTVLGFVGFIRDWHGLDRVVRYVAERADPALHLLIIGDGPGREGLLAQAKQLGVGSQVTVTGVLPRDEVGRWLRAFDVALQPNVTEYASPLKLFEYLYLGLAVVAPDTPNMREVLRDGDNAVLFDPAKQGDFQRALDRLVRDSGMRVRLGAAARRTIFARDMTWDSNARRVVALATACGPGRARRAERGGPETRGGAGRDDPGKRDGPVPRLLACFVARLRRRTPVT
jgi:glycosyltransferase involved in cell wall biosynthesis